MRLAAIGVRMHSGWGVLVAVSNDGGRLSVVERRRVDVIDEHAGGKKQPYHFAKNMALLAAEKYLAHAAAESQRLARDSIRALAENLQSRDYRIMRCAVLTASGRALPELAGILAAHPLIHTAEGEFFRNAVCSACEEMKIAVTRVRERDVEKEAKAALGKSTAAAMKKIADAGKTLGSPWTQDHKKAALAAWIILHQKKT